MAHGIGEVLSEGNSSVKIVNNNAQSQNLNNQARKSIGVMGSRRIFAAAFKLKVLDSYRNDIDCRGNQRATARKYGIHRRQIQKWLQCEDNLRSSCAENSNTNGVIVGNNTVPSTTGHLNSTSIVNTSEISKTVEPTIVTSSSSSSTIITPTVQVAAATAAPALNLSLARLHGDELTTRQGPPPSHSTTHCGSLTKSAQHIQHRTSSNSLPMHTLLIGYTQYSGHDLNQQQQSQQSLQQHHSEDSAAAATINNYQTDRTESPTERKYYVLSHAAYEQSASVNRSSKDARPYHQLQQASATPSYQATTGHGYNGIVNRDNRILGSNVHLSSSHVLVPPLSSSSSSSSSSFSSSSSHHSHVRDVDSPPGNESLASSIKTERASPDFPTTAMTTMTVPCNEATNCPTNITKTFIKSVYPMSQHVHIPVSGIATQAVLATAIHFETPTRRTSRQEAANVHVNVETHMCNINSKKRDGHTELVYVKAGDDDDKQTIKNEIEDIYVPKEEIFNEQNEVDTGVTEDSRRTSNDDGDGGMQYSPQYIFMSQNTNSEVPSTTVVSPLRESSLSVLLSPKGAPSNSSSRSTISSCSDSEIDPLDYSSGHHNTINDLSRRRSFSLRFKLDVLDAFHGSSTGIAGNQRATARKFGINRRQVQKWLGQETDLRGEIALRGGDTRQRLAPLQELPVIDDESAVDLRTSSITRSDIEIDHYFTPIYCCDSSSQRFDSYLPISVDSDIPQRICTFSCCMDNSTISPRVTSCYREVKRSSYQQQQELQQNYYCYSVGDPMDMHSGIIERTSSATKRSGCNLDCCYDDVPSVKRLCVETTTELEYSMFNKEKCQDQPQEAPLCLVKSKCSNESPLQTQRVTSTVPTPPAPAAAAAVAPVISTKKDAILFKPYLDNPVSKPNEESPCHDNSPLENHHQGISHNKNNNNINNNNCSSICNFNEEQRAHDYAVELSLRVPVSWSVPSQLVEFPERIRSAFARYPATPYYI